MATGDVHETHCRRLAFTPMSTQWLLFLHLAGAFLFVAGAVAAAALRIAAMRGSDRARSRCSCGPCGLRYHSSCSASFSSSSFGFWLVDRLGYDLGATWLTLTFVLLAWAVVVGGLTGRQDRHTRELGGAPARRRRPPERGAARSASATRSTSRSTPRCSSRPSESSRSWSGGPSRVACDLNSSAESRLMRAARRAARRAASLVPTAIAGSLGGARGRSAVIDDTGSHQRAAIGRRCSAAARLAACRAGASALRAEFNVHRVTAQPGTCSFSHSVTCDAVLVPLLALELDVAREDVLAERALHELGAGELLDRLAERLREARRCRARAARSAVRR